MERGGKKEGKKEKERERESSNCWFTPQMGTIARGGLSQSQEPEIPTVSHTMAEAQVLKPFSAAFPGIFAESWIRS